MFRSAKHIIILAVAALLTIVILRKTNLIPSFSDVFAPRPIRMEETPMVVQDIHELAQLATMSAEDEVVADSLRLGTTDVIVHLLPLPNSLSNPDRLVIIGKGKVVAGMDLKNLKEEDIHITKDSVSIRLPRATILEVIMNPSDFSTFSEEGDWLPEAVTRVKIKARDILVKRALDHGLLEQSQARGESIMKNFLNATGFKKVAIVH